MMSTFDQHGVRYLTAIANAFTYKYMGSLPETITLPARRRRLDGTRRVFSLIQVKNENQSDKHHNPINRKRRISHARNERSCSHLRQPHPSRGSREGTSEVWV
jgi:hypothetical protein